MSHYNHQQAPAVSYPPSVTAYPPAGQAYPAASYVTAPPPMGYPTKDASGHPEQGVPEQTTSRGDGFLKGCCAAICCCCVLDWCF